MNPRDVESAHGSGIHQAAKLAVHPVGMVATWGGLATIGWKFLEALLGPIVRDGVVTPGVLSDHILSILHDTYWWAAAGGALLIVNFVRKQLEIGSRR